MKYVKLGKTDIEVSDLSLGCWSFAGGTYWGSQDENDSKRTIDAAIDLGINFLDTAEAYERGVSERVVGAALQGRRDKVVLATKVAGKNHLYADKMILACEESLKNLRTDYADLYYIHWPDMGLPFDEPMEGLFRLKKQGKIRAGGISNFGLKQLSMLEETGMTDLLEVHQLPYNLFWRSIEYGIQRRTMELGLGIVCYSTLAQGLLTGRYASAADVPDNLKVVRFYADPEGVRHGGKGCEEEAFAALRELKELCAEAGLTLPQACLAWLYRQKGVTSLLTGPRNVGELLENVKCVGVKISDDMADGMTAISEKVMLKIGGNTDMWMTGDKIRTF